MKKYLESTPILDYDSPNITKLIEQRNWNSLEADMKIREIYNYVRDDIKFGYNIDDNISASIVLKDGYGQCNTKSNLFMALLRAVNIPNRIHGFTINKALQKGAITGIWYLLSPKNILHSWVEVFYDNKWYNLEGLILDKPYLKALQNLFPECSDSFCGYGVFTESLSNPQIEWNVNNTYIQERGINNDFGLFDSPDKFYGKHQQKLNWIKKVIYKKYVRHLMNNNVRKIRNNGG